MSSMQIDSTPDSFAVLKPVKSPSDGPRYKAYYSETQWPSLEQAAKWAEKHNIDRQYAIKVEKRAFLESVEKDFRTTAAQTTKPHLLVFESNGRIRVIVGFGSQEYCDCWATAYFKKTYSATRSYEILDPDNPLLDPRLDEMTTIEYQPPETTK